MIDLIKCAYAWIGMITLMFFCLESSTQFIIVYCMSAMLHTHTRATSPHCLGKCCCCCCLHMQATQIIIAEWNRRDRQPRASVLLIVTDGPGQLNNIETAGNAVRMCARVCVSICVYNV